MFFNRCKSLRAGCVCFAWLWLLGASSLPAQSDVEPRSIQAMCRAGLVDTAVDYVTARRELASDDPSRSALWTKHLMECHALAALYSETDSASHWEQCRHVYQSFVDLQPTNPRIPWLQWQVSRCDLLHAQSEMALYLAAPANQAPREQALGLIRKMLSELEQLDDDVARRQPRAAREGLQGAAEAPAEQLNALAVDAGLLRCEALLLRTRLYPLQSADRIASATEVDQQAAAWLQRTIAASAIKEQLQVAQATARLELGDESSALRELERLASTASGETARQRAAIAAIENMTRLKDDARNNASVEMSRARALLELLQADEAGPEAELASMHIALADLQRHSGGAKQAALQALLAQSLHIGAQYGDYWRSRSEALLVGAMDVVVGDGTAPNHTTSDNDASTLAIDIVLVEVRQLLAADNAPAAIDKLLMLRDNQAAAGQGAGALRAATLAAALLQRAQSWAAAADALTSVSRQFAQLPTAAQAHRQAIFALSQALLPAPNDSQLSARYSQLLEDQLVVWPDASATTETIPWLTAWKMRTGERNALASLLLQHAVTVDQIDDVRATLNQTTAPANSAPQPNAARITAIAEQSLLAWLGAVLNLENDNDVAQQLAKLHEARLAGRFGRLETCAELVQQGAQVTALLATDAQLRQAVSQLPINTAQLDSAQHQLALSIRWLMILREYQFLGERSRTLEIPAAARLSADLAQWQPAQLPPTIREGLAHALTRAIDETPPQQHRQWAERLLLDDNWRELLLASPSPSSQALGYRWLVWSENPSQAVGKLTQLAQQQGRNGAGIELQLASALTDIATSNQAESQQALLRSRQLLAKVIANTPSGSEWNWQARWRLIKNQLQQGEVEAARQSASLLLATQPPQAELWKARLESLAALPPR